MTRERLIELFEIHDDDHCQDHLVKNARHPRNDVAAMLLLHELLPDETTDIISWAGHDEISFSPVVRQVVERITEDQVVELIRYGVRLINESYFGMFV